MELSGVDKSTSTHKTLSSEFWFLWPEVRSVCDLTIIRQRKHVQCHLFRKYKWELDNYINIFLHHTTTLDDPCTVLTQWPLRVIQGHIRSVAFLHLTSDWIEIKHWGRSHCISLAGTHRLIFSKTYLVHRWPYVTLIWGHILTWIFQCHPAYIS